MFFLFFLLLFFLYFFLSQVEATKFTEVGFHGRDVDQIIKDLVEVMSPTSAVDSLVELVVRGGVGSGRPT